MNDMRKHHNDDVGLTCPDRVSYQANDRTPHLCPPKFEMVRRAARSKWSDSPICRAEILSWLEDGAPDGSGSMLLAAIHQPPIPGQPSDSSEQVVNQLIDLRIFVRSTA